MIITKMIENSDHSDKDYESRNYDLFVDGEYLPMVYVRSGRLKNEEEELEFEFYTSDIYSGEKILSQKIEDFPKFEYINVPVNINSKEFETDIYVHSTTHNSKRYRVTFYFDAKLLSWKESYSFTDFERTLLEVVEENKIEDVKIEIFNNEDETRFTVETRIKIGKLSLLEEFSPFFEKCKNIYLHIRERTLENINNEIFTNHFNFPKGIRTSCEQYLLYFAQFLKDLGINATSNLKEDAGKVLFSVTPTGDVEALDKIREALAVYLKLPESPIVYDDSFAAMRLHQQIENLQHSQKMAVREIQVNEKLLIAQSDMIREKNLTISQQQTVIDQQHKIIEKISSKSIMMDSAEKKEELEELYEGVKVGESKWLYELTGIKVNPAKVIKTAVNNTLGKQGENKSVLGLDDIIDERKFKN